jgi:hypothetical protein
VAPTSVSDAEASQESQSGDGKASSRADKADKAESEAMRPEDKETVREQQVRVALGARLVGMLGDTFRQSVLAEEPVRIGLGTRSLAAEAVWTNRPFHIHDAQLDRRFNVALDEYLADRTVDMAAAARAASDSDGGGGSRPFAAAAPASRQLDSISSNSAQSGSKGADKTTGGSKMKQRATLSSPISSMASAGPRSTRVLLALPIPDLANAEPLKQSLPIGSLVAARTSPVDLEPWEHLQIMDLIQLAAIAIRMNTKLPIYLHINRELNYRSREILV